MVLAAIAASLTGNATEASSWVDKASALLMEHPAEGSEHLARAGKALLAIDRPELAIELFDEAMECAILAGDDERHEQLVANMVQGELALDDSDRQNLPELRRLLDGLTTVAPALQR